MGDADLGRRMGARSYKPEPMGKRVGAPRQATSVDTVSRDRRLSISERGRAGAVNGRDGGASDTAGQPLDRNRRKT